MLSFFFFFKFRSKLNPDFSHTCRLEVFMSYDAVKFMLLKLTARALIALSADFKRTVAGRPPLMNDNILREKIIREMNFRVRMLALVVFGLTLK